MYTSSSSFLLRMAPLALFLFPLFTLPLQTDCSKLDDSLNQEERQALIDFNTSLPHSTKSFIWDALQPACSWKGVTCGPPDNKTVIYLRMPGKSFVGQIPPNTIGRLTSLRVLSLRVNGFHGPLPPDFANLAFLTHLSLNNNNFSGAVPSFFTNFKALVRFTINNNSFSGQLPYIHSENLVKFDVSFNKLKSSIPHSLSKFPLSNFTQNVFLCGAPTNFTCNETFPFPQAPPEDKKERKTPEILGISLGSALLLLIILWCVRKAAVCKQTLKPPSQGAVKEEMNKLVLFEEGVYGFDLEDLLKSSAEVLGEGGVGISYKQVLEGKKTTVVVVKRLKGVVVTEHEFRTRMGALGKMKNENVVPLIGYYYSKDEKWLVYDYMAGGTLSSRLHDGRTRLDWDHRMRIALSSAKGLQYLHSGEVIHGNIKSSNILFQEETNNEPSVTDYGLNILFGSVNDQVTGYGAPQVPNTQKVVTCESDVYSFGVLLLELLTGQVPKQDSFDKEGLPFSNWVESIVCKEPKAEIFDVELRVNCMEEMMQLFEIAKECVSSLPDQQSITMQDVVSKMEDMWSRKSSDGHSKGYDDTPSTATRDTPSTITP